MYKFEKLTVWNEAMVFCKASYELASKLPIFEKNGLSDQLRRSSTSILLNIAEGNGGDSDREFLRYLFIARKSLYETVALAKFIEYQHKINVESILDQAEMVGKLLSGLIRKLKSNS